MQAPFGGTLWGRGVGSFAKRLETSLGVRVYMTERARACRARLAIPGGVSTREAFELAALQASLCHVWIAVEGETFLAVGLSGPEVLLAAIRAVGSQTPWAEAPRSAAEALAYQSEVAHELERDAIAEMESAGVVVSRPSLDAFEPIVRPRVWEELASRLEGGDELLERLRQETERVRTVNAN